MKAPLLSQTETNPKPARLALRRHRILILVSHPVQYASPVFREMARHPRLDIQVTYCHLDGAIAAKDSGFGVEVKWDLPLLEGYPWTRIPNWSPRPGLGRFFGLSNPGVWRMVRSGNYDAVQLLTGYRYLSFWVALLAAKIGGVPVLFGTDATTIEPREDAKWKIPIKKIVMPWIYGMADISLVTSQAGKEFMLSLGLASDRIVVEPLVVDNDWWKQRASEVDRASVRKGWNVPSRGRVVLYCAKLQHWKRPMDLLRAFAKAELEDAFLVYAGEGPLRRELEAQSAALGIAERVRFLGFINQSALPAVYASADVFVLPSEYDPCPAVVCEAMLCGTPVVLSDQIRGRFDQVLHEKTGFHFPCGNVGALAETLRNALLDPIRLRTMSEAGLLHMESCAPQTNVAALVEALDRIEKRREACGKEGFT